MDRSLEEPAAPLADPWADPEYEVTDWKGLPNYHCPHCDYADLRRGEVKGHIRRRHRR